jgi:hypothetical protein
VAVHFNKATTPDDDARLSVPIEHWPSVVGRRAVFAMSGLWKDPGTKTKLFAVPSATANKGVLLVYYNHSSGTVVGISEGASNAIAQVGAGFDGVTEWAPFVIVCRFRVSGANTVLDLSARCGAATPESAGGGLTGAPPAAAASGVFGVGANPATLSFYQSGQARELYLGPIRVSTYADDADVPDPDDVRDAIWSQIEAGVLDESGLGPGSADVWQPNAAPLATFRMLHGTTTNRFGTNDEAVGIGQPVKVTSLPVWPSGANFRDEVFGVELVGEHVHVDPFVDDAALGFPSTRWSPLATDESAAIPGDATRGGLAPRVAARHAAAPSSPFVRLYVGVQSYDERPDVSYAPALVAAGDAGGGGAAGDNRPQGLLAALAVGAAAGGFDGGAVGVALEGLQRQDSQQFLDRDGRRLGFRIDQAGDLVEQGAIVDLSASTAHELNRFGTGGRVGVISDTRTDLLVSGGPVYVGTPHASSDEVYACAFQRFGAIDDDDPVRITAYALRYPGGPSSVAYQAETHSGQGNYHLVGGQVFAGGVADLDSGGALGQVDSVVETPIGGGGVPSGSDTLYVSGLSELDIDTAEVSAAAAAPWDSSLPRWGVYLPGTGAVVEVKVAVWSTLPSPRWALQLARPLVNVPSPTDAVRVGRISAVPLEVSGVTGDASNRYVRVRVTKSASAAEGPLVVVARSCRATARGGEVVGALGTGGVRHSYQVDTAEVGLWAQMAAAESPDVVHPANTAEVSQADFEAHVDNVRAAAPAADVFGVFSPMRAADFDDISRDADAGARENYRAAMVAKGVPYVDQVDDVGSAVTQVLRGYLADATHASAHGGLAHGAAYLASEAALAVGSGVGVDDAVGVRRAMALQAGGVRVISGAMPR